MNEKNIIKIASVVTLILAATAHSIDMDALKENLQKLCA